MVFQEAVAGSGPVLKAAVPGGETDRLAPQTVGLVTLAAIGGAFADAAPTGTAWWDVLLRMGFCGLLTYAAACAPSQLLLTSAVIATAFAATSGALPLAVLAVVGALATLWIHVDPETALPERVGWAVRAVTSFVLVLALLRLPALGFFGLQTLVVALVTVVLVGTLLAQLAPRTRRIVAIAALVVGGLAFIFLLVGGVAILGVRSRAEDGISAARRGLDAARAADTETLSTELNVAAVALNDTHERLSHPLLKPLRIIPVVAQNHRALEVAASEGSEVAISAAVAAEEADIGSLRFRQGAIDLGRLEAMAPQLTETAERLRIAQAEVDRTRGGWLAPPLADELSTLSAELDEALDDAATSASAASLLPKMLGVDGPRRYLILVGAPGETRDFGGFVGAYGLIELSDGDLSLIEGGRALDLAPSVSPAGLDDPLGYPTQFRNNEPEIYPQNLTSTPNIEIVARAVRDLFPELSGRPIDGVIYLDQFAIAAMLELTGPVEVREAGVRLTSETAIDFFFRDQYVDFESRADVWDAISSVLSAAVLGLEGSDLPGPERLGEVLGPSARQGRLQVATFDDAENAFLQSVRLQRVFTKPPTTDSIAVVASQGTTSKLDLYLYREIRYAVRFDEDDRFTAQLDIVLRSEVPDDAPRYTLAFDNPDPGTNRVLLSVYSPHLVTAVSVDGIDHQWVTEQEFGLNRHSLFSVDVPANGRVQASLEFAGTMNPDAYELAIWHQPTVRPDSVTVEVVRPNEAPQVVDMVVDENVVLSVPNN